MKPVFKVLLMAIAYLATFVIGSLTGLIHPMCYACRTCNEKAD